MLSSCVTPSYMNALWTMALTGNNRKGPRFAKNNLIRIIMEVKRADKRKMDEMRVDVGVTEEEIGKEHMGDGGLH